MYPSPGVRKKPVVVAAGEGTSDRGKMWVDGAVVDAAIRENGDQKDVLVTEVGRTLASSQYRCSSTRTANSSNTSLQYEQGIRWHAA